MDPNATNYPTTRGQSDTYLYSLQLFYVSLPCTAIYGPCSKPKCFLFLSTVTAAEGCKFVEWAAIIQIPNRYDECESRDRYLRAFLRGTLNECTTGLPSRPSVCLQLLGFRTRALENVDFELTVCGDLIIRASLLSAHQVGMGKQPLQADGYHFI